MLSAAIKRFQVGLVHGVYSESTVLTYHYKENICSKQQIQRHQQHHYKDVKTKVWGILYPTLTLPGNTLKMPNISVLGVY